MDGLEDNSRFFPGPDAGAGPAVPFSGQIEINQAQMSFEPPLQVTHVGGRDAQLFPAARLALVSMDDILVPLQWGEMIAESSSVATSSYWSLIPQFGRIWRDPSDSSGWCRGALPLMLVNDLENHAHQGLARFRYCEGRVEDFQFQFVQQTSPYLLRQHFVAWGQAHVRTVPLFDSTQENALARARAVLARRLPTRSWQDLAQMAPGVDWSRFGRPLDREWVVSLALVTPPGFARADVSTGATMFHQPGATASGEYPYPLEMRFGVRSVLKSIAAPLSLLRLAQVYGPQVLTMRIGDHVTGLDPKYDQVRFIDAANMTTGFGGAGTLQTRPNEFEDGQLGADYDGWYTAPSHAEKLAHIQQWLRPYPWEPGTIPRYRDQDYYLLGAALDNFLKSLRGMHADIWEMLCTEVFAPIGIAAAPTTRTREPLSQLGLPWFNAGYFPTLDDLAKIALLYQGLGAWGGQQILHRRLTADLLAGEGAIAKRDWSIVSGNVPRRPPEERPVSPTHYRMGFHFTPHFSRKSGRLRYLPTMWGSGETEVILFPNGMVSIRIGKAAGVAGRVFPHNEISWGTIEAVEALAGWE